MKEKTTEELQQLHNRLVVDVSRSRVQDRDGLSQNSPLVRNLRNVEEELVRRKTEQK